MTKKDYVKIAKVIADSADINEPKIIWYSDFVSNLIPVFEDDNPNFDRQVFKKAISDVYDARKGRRSVNVLTKSGVEVSK